VDLLAWLKRLGCRDIPTLARAEPDTLRYGLLHVPAQLVHRARLPWLRVPACWPWSDALTLAFDRIRSLPQPNPADQYKPRPDGQEDPGGHAHRRDSRPPALPQHPKHPPLAMSGVGKAELIRPAKNLGRWPVARPPCRKG
jgi:hypothetical protein